MVTLYPLSSGSSGNCFYLSAGESLGGLLIDAGISARRIRQSLWEASIDPAGLRGILITHDHVDHIAGLRVLARKLRLPVYATAGTLQRLAAAVEPGTRLIELQKEQEIAAMGVQPFATQHDAPDSCGFRITAGSRVIGFATDLGCVTPTVWEHLLGTHLTVLESNYEDSVLLNCGYPYYLKQRIRSEYGHLSGRWRSWPGAGRRILCWRISAGKATRRRWRGRAPKGRWRRRTCCRSGITACGSPRGTAPAP